MRRWTTGKRLVAGFAAILAILLALGGFALQRLLKIRASANAMAVEHLPGAMISARINALVRANYAQTLAHVVAGDAEISDNEVEQTIAAASDRISRLLSEHHWTVSSHAERELFEAIKRPREEYHRVRSEVVWPLSRAGRREEAVAALQEELEPALERYTRAVDALAEWNAREGRTAGQRIEADVRAAIAGTGGGVLVAFAIVAALAVVLVRATDAAERAVRASLHEKEILLREIHHRVKNNLQIVSSLLYFQATKARTTREIAVFADSRNRLRSMMLVHEKLYRSGNVARVEFSEYVRSLTADLLESLVPVPGQVDLLYDLEPVTLSIEEAVPVGMIVCELVTNAFKHAFPEGRRGLVRITARARGRAVEIVTADDGVGLPVDFDHTSGETFGWQLVRNLVAQIGGQLSVEGQAGTRVRLAFERQTGPVNT